MGAFDDLIPANSGTFDDLIPPRGVMDKLTGATGERYQTWPERLIRGVGSAIASGATLPRDVMLNAQQQPPPGTMSDSDVGPMTPGRIVDMAAIGMPVSAATQAGERAIPGVAKNLAPVRPSVPSTEALRNAGAADIEAAKASGLELTGRSVADLAFRVKQKLFDSGIHPVDAPATYAKIAELERAPSSAFVTASNLQSLRSSLGHTAQNFNPQAAKDQLAATRAIRELDEFLPSINPKDVLAGNPSATAELFGRGRENYAAAMRSNDITGNLDKATTGILETAELRAQAANSGRNLDNTIRQRVASALTKEKDVSGLSDAEIAALKGVVEGGRGRNFSRYLGNILGGGGGIGQTGVSAIGAGIGGLAGMSAGAPTAGAVIGAVAPATIGSGARSLANLLAKRDLGKADELIRMRSPLYREAAEGAGMTPVSPAQRAALIRALMATSQDQQ